MSLPSLQIVKDTKYPEMYRILFKDGTLSDMANISWTKEKMRRINENTRRRKNLSDIFEV